MNKNGMADTMKGLVDESAQRVDALKSRVMEAKDQAIHRGGELLDNVAGLIKTHPLKAVGIAFAAGYLGMRLFRR